MSRCSSLEGDPLDVEAIRTFARAMLNLVLNEADAAALSSGLKRLNMFVQAVERVRLEFLDDPFVMPRDADAWLDAWPAEHH